MAEIKAFQGILYNPEKINGSLEEVVAPPYDVINDEARENLYNQNPHNIVRLILGKENEGDNDTNNKYSRADDFLGKWIEEGALARDEKPAIYLYNQEYISEGVKKVRKGYIALIKLEEFEKGVVLPHEATLAKPVEDRLKLFRASRCNLSQVFGLYSDRERSLDNLLDEAGKNLDSVSLKDGNGDGHEMWRLTDSESINRIVEFMKEKKIIIADGHHRYTTALAYKKEMEEKHGADPGAPYNYVMMYFTNMYGEGISVGPIHRVVHGVDFNREELLQGLKADFHVEEINDASQGEVPEALSKKMKDAAGEGTALTLYFGKGDYCFLKAKGRTNLAAKVSVDGPEDVKLLDVTIVHSLLLEGALKINKEDVKSQKNIIYKKDPVEAITLVDKGAASMACIMNATRVDQVESVAGRGYIMPQKSTFFYPKLLSGLVISSIGRL